MTLSVDAWGRLVLDDDEGRRHPGVEPIRAFPLSEPGRYIALCDPDGRELVWIDDLAACSSDFRQPIEAALARREFAPVILQILSVSADSAPNDWHVVTDRGITRVTVKTDDDIHRLGPRRVLIHDAHGIRYDVPDVAALDAASRRLLERYL
jgi:hypothetical protein